MGIGEKGMSSSLVLPFQVTEDSPGPFERAPGKETEQQGAPPSPSRYRHLPTQSGTFPLLGTHWPSLHSPGVGPAARRPVQMRPGCCSRLASAASMGRL